MPKKNKPFINLEYLEESSGGDFPHYESLAKDLYEKIRKINKPQLFAVVGEAWVWKSTLINKVEKLSKWEKWIQFDAWRYPERKELREWFIIELHEKLTWSKAEVIIRKIEWGDKERIKRVKWTLFVIAVLAFLVDVVHGPKYGKNYFSGTILGIWLLLFERVLEKLTDVTPKDLALTRVIQLENLAIGLLEKTEHKRIYVILEDVDRAWEEWLNFLETLSYFLKHKLPKHKLPNQSVTIVPIVLVSQHDWNSNMNAYLKCVDNYFIFPNGFLLDWINGFITEAFHSSDVVFQDILRSELKKILSRSWWWNYRFIKFVIRKIGSELAILSDTYKDINSELFVALHVWNIERQMTKNASNANNLFLEIFNPHKENSAYIGHNQKYLLKLIPKSSWIDENDVRFEYSNIEKIDFEKNIVLLPLYYRL